VAEGGHGRERRGFSLGERADGLVAIEKSVERGQVDIKDGGVKAIERGAGSEGKPVDDVALDGLGEVVDCVGAVGEAEVDDCRSAGFGLAGPEDVGGVEIVVRPQRRDCAQMGAQLPMEGLEQGDGMLGVFLGCRVGGEGWASGDVSGERGNRVVGGEDGEAGDEGAIETTRS